MKDKQILTISTKHMNFRVDLDTVDPADEEFIQFLKMNDIGARVLQAFGPGGGNPLVRYTGSRITLSKMITEQFGGNVDLLPELIVNRNLEPVSPRCRCQQQKGN
jgi:hypothetical protein